MPTIQLFRIKLHKPRQLVLFPPDLDASSILLEAIQEKPLRLMKRGEWRIGNVHHIDASGLYFKLGKKRRAVRESVRDGDFEEELGEEYLSTHVVIDINLEICGIVSRQDLAKTENLANHLRWLLQSTRACGGRLIDVQVDPVRDPQKFIDMLRAARRIESFRFVVTRPNMFDTEKLFVKPAEQFVKETGFEEAAISLKHAVGEAGGDLETLEPIIRNAAAIGKDVSARVVMEEGGRPVLKHLNKNYVSRDIGDFDPNSDADDVLHEVRQSYATVRRSDGDRP